MRIPAHPILGPLPESRWVNIEVDGEIIQAREGEPIAAAIMAAGRLKLRHTRKSHEPRGVFCGIGRCTDCVMTVDGQANVRTCVTPVRAGMKIFTQGQADGQGAEKCEN